ncbi:hypothetical protein [Bacillus sp. Bos-x628]|uniref:hypothetical protein n=1 Tax=Bacillus maqinnsis TaxID=3229854 RepID=UPI00338EFBF7
MMTITFVIYQDTQSVAYAAVFALIRTLCQLLAGLISPVLTDRFHGVEKKSGCLMQRLFYFSFNIVNISRAIVSKIETTGVCVVMLARCIRSSVT